MSNFIFLDTETTGNTEKDFLCQIAYKINNEVFSGTYKPTIAIPPEASCVHHITNKMVAQKESFAKSLDFQKIKKILEDKDNILVCHNAPFDIMILKKEGITPKNFICTLRLARYIDDKEEIPQYKLQFLRYFLNVDIDAQPHSATGDVLVLEKIFEILRKKLIDKSGLSENEINQKMIEISSRPSIFKYIKFGKYANQKIEDILTYDKGYLNWLLSEKLKSDRQEEDWIYTLKYYLGK